MRLSLNNPPIGEKFGNLTVRDFHSREKGVVRWVFECDCGNTKIIIADHVKRGNTITCGCALHWTPVNATHMMGGSSDPIERRCYSSWCKMKSRCLNVNNNRFKNYGGRGISFCREWDGFDAFLNDMGLPPTRNHSIDRVDVNADYCKENCKWSDDKEQANNKTNSHIITINGVSMTVSQWAVKNGINPRIAHTRISRGWSEIDAVSIPLRIR